MTDGNGPSAEVDDLDLVGVACLFVSVDVIASMDRVDSAGGHRIIGLLVGRVEHRASPFWRSCLSIHGTAVRRSGSSGDGADSPDERRSVGRVIA
jgi:hypothetical protein